MDPERIKCTELLAATFHNGRPEYYANIQEHRYFRALADLPKIRTVRWRQERERKKAASADEQLETKEQRNATLDG